MTKQGRRGRVGAGHEDLHLCNNYRHLMMALATILASGKPAVVVYLEDYVPLSPALRTRLARVCPMAEIIISTDRAEQSDFTQLPAILPDLLRRNLRLGRKGVCRPKDWQPSWLAGRRFATGYLCHSGLFFSKVVAGVCSHVVLREDGLNNYHAHPVPPMKALVRFAAGLPAWQQIWGEEAWVDEIEVSIIEKLPTSVRGKARQLTFSGVMQALPAQTARDLGTAFLGDQPQLATTQEHEALLLTQPLDGVNLCSIEEKHAIYSKVADHLRTLGYRVYVKHHPRDLPFSLEGTSEIPATFPIEVWPFVGHHRFDLAIALCSAALISGAQAFAESAVQLLPPEAFNQKSVQRWDADIAAALQRLLPPQR